MSHDPVTNPSHYTRGGIELTDIIEAYDLGWHLGNVLKYVLRCPYKGRTLEDLKKSRWYLERAIKLLEENPEISLPQGQSDVAPDQGF